MVAWRDSLLDDSSPDPDLGPTRDSSFSPLPLSRDRNQPLSVTTTLSLSSLSSPAMKPLACQIDEAWLIDLIAPFYKWED